MMKTITFRALSVLFLILGLVTACGKEAPIGTRAESPVTVDSFALDTYCNITMYEGGGKEAQDAVREALDAYDDLLNPSEEASDIYRINHRNDEKETERVKIDEKTAALLETASLFCTLSGGKLEPAIKPVTSVWDFKIEKKIPDEAVLKEALSRVKSQKWHLDGEYFVAEDKDVQIDVGAIAKGYIADRLAEVLREQGVSSAVINLGGNVLCVGSKPDGTAFKIGIQDPNAADERAYVEVVEVSDASVVTAGVYERYFFEGDVRYHHIIDPADGYPARTGLLSVTVVGKSSEICDAMATAVFIMGEEKGRAFVEQYNRDFESDYKLYFIHE